jgi:hypothetical protein
VKNPYIKAIERRMDRLRAPKTETFRDPASGRSETIEKGEWQGSMYEYQLFTSLLKEFQTIAAAQKKSKRYMSTDQKPAYARIYKMTPEGRVAERGRAQNEINLILNSMTLAQLLRVELFVKGMYERQL